MSPSADHVDDEMHELNQEADYLDQSVTMDPPSSTVNGHKPASTRGLSGGGHDPEAQAQVIESLRSQVQDLFSQVSQLNAKLVRSYDRVSDLEDELHVTSGNLRNATLKVSQLQLENTQHLSALSTGLLVEKSHVTAELTRLMEQATEEAARAGEAESARHAIEKDLDDLSAGLFTQANTMVAEARLARARSERKVEETEEALRGAEEIVGLLQAQLQSLQAEKEASDKKVEQMRELMGKGKWIERPQLPSRVPKVRLLAVHSQYVEYIQFIAYLKTTRPTTLHPPAMSTLLPQPFLARLVAEDSYVPPSSLVTLL
jgi:Rab guanine nucleotide exchange factor SEC2